MLVSSACIRIVIRDCSWEGLCVYEICKIQPTKLKYAFRASTYCCGYNAAARFRDFLADVNLKVLFSKQIPHIGFVTVLP